MSSNIVPVDGFPDKYFPESGSQPPNPAPRRLVLVARVKSFSFSVKKQGSLPPLQQLTIAVADEATGEEVPIPVSATIWRSVNWLSISPDSGNTVFTASIGLASDAPKMAPGSYSTQIQVSTSSTEVVNRAVFASVALEVLKKK